jgi:hypothetical protein
MLHFASLVQVHIIAVKNIKIYEEHIICEEENVQLRK